MRPTDRLHLVADLRDLQIVDKNGEFCGIVDDIELEGKPGGRLAVKALLVGPGAYRGRLAGAALWAIQRLAGDQIVRVPWTEVKQISSLVTLARPARELGLGKSEDKALRWLPRIGSEDASV